MDGDHMGEHGRWVHEVKTWLLKRYMFQWGYVSRAQVAWALKHVPGYSLKLDMFRRVVGFKVHVLWHMNFDRLK